MAFVRLPAGQPAAGTKAADGGQHLPLKSLAPLEIRLCAAELDQELPHQGANGGVLLGGPDPGPPVDVVGQ